MLHEDVNAKSYTWLTARELAARWHVNPVTLYRAVARGKIPALRIGKATRFPLELVEQTLIRNVESAAAESREDERV